jgi:prepilin-type N-terminal cleavage/methylation domain-containing protein
MIVSQLNRLFGKGQDRGFTLIELLIVVLIVGILAAVATPIYLGYVKDAKTAEAKAIAGSLWSAIQANAIGTCGVTSAVSQGYPKAGLTSGGVTTPDRWSVSAGGTNTLLVDCTTSAYTASTPDLFTLTGDTTDVNFVRVKLNYTAAGTPPSTLKCSTDGGTTFVAC